MISERYEFSRIIKEDGSSSLLIIRVITRIKHFDSWLLAWFNYSGCDTISNKKGSKILMESLKNEMNLEFVELNLP